MPDLPRSPAGADHPVHRGRRAIDEDGLAANVERLIAAGVGGLVPGGSTGEFTTLAHAERRGWSSAPSPRPPAASRSSPAPAPSPRPRPSSSASTPSSGAAAVMIVPPFYDPLGFRELLAHYAAVADASRSRSCTTTSRAPRA